MKVHTLTHSSVGLFVLVNLDNGYYAHVAKVDDNSTYSVWIFHSTLSRVKFEVHGQSLSGVRKIIMAANDMDTSDTEKPMTYQEAMQVMYPSTYPVPFTEDMGDPDDGSFDDFSYPNSPYSELLLLEGDDG